MHLRLLTSSFLFAFFRSIMASTTNSTSEPVTRIACFTSAFLDLYAQHPELIVASPKGGRPLNTPLDLTNVKRDKEWDTGFVVVFKVRCLGP
jgi:hypothetical protein